ncbi:MAG: tRNA (adenosine(37)-N6)-threonylcarbamoyltransferase complex dimerization subunit type 1 TsaB [Nitrosomonadales bacterium]|nr:MAG: tRNA (adenosine(37)-N6)-threonylcarbamoyltransferase complex dimerization subunit type 1 TsaB [Nitrosomonadales bacterium]
MKLLALDTSTENCSVALWLDGEVLSRQELAGQRHSDLILPMLEDLLGEAGITLKSLDGIAFGEGPGSFTGLRIGCGVAQGLALGADLPVLGISTLLALAAAAPGDRVLACLDARIGEIYHAAYEKQQGVWHAVSEPSLCYAKDAPDLPGAGWIGAGSAFAAYAEALQQRYGELLLSFDGSVYPQARDMVKLAAPLFGQGLGGDAALAAPLYIRNKVAMKTVERA